MNLVNHVSSKELTVHQFFCILHVVKQTVYMILNRKIAFYDNLLNKICLLNTDAQTATRPNIATLRIQVIIRGTRLSILVSFKRGGKMRSEPVL